MQHPLLLTHRLHHAVILFGKVAGCSCAGDGSHDEQCLASLGRETIVFFQNSCCTDTVFADTCVLERELLCSLSQVEIKSTLPYETEHELSVSFTPERPERIRKANTNPTS